MDSVLAYHLYHFNYPLNEMSINTLPRKIILTTNKELVAIGVRYKSGR